MDNNEYEKLLTEAKNIELNPVISSNIAGIGYNEQNQLLKVSFKNKNGYSLYVYENVPLDVYRTVISSASIGKALSEHIIRQKDKYKFIKL